MSQTTTYGAGALALHAPPVRRTANPSSFVREHNAGSLLRSTSALYRSNFSRLFLCYFLPMFSVALFQQVATVYEISWLAIAALPLNLILPFLATGAVTVTISDICLGNSPSLRRSYGRLLRQRLWLRMLWTGLLQILLILPGLLLFVVPGLVLAVRLMFSASIVVIERSSGASALRRSRELTKGAFWRLAGTTMLLMAMMASAFVVLSLVVGLINVALGSLGADERLLLTVATLLVHAFIQGLLYPFFFIAQILLYYDLRVRKEAYDATMLAEDVMR